MERAGTTRYQELSSEYSVGDIVQLLEGSLTDRGRVVQVFPAIGMVDVHLGGDTTRFPVEDLLRLNPEEAAEIPSAVEFNEVPGGEGVVPVSGGPLTGPSPIPGSVVPSAKMGSVRTASVERVAEAFVVKAIYWASRDRQYRATKSEMESGEYGCPKCKQGSLASNIYKRREGQSSRLMCCPSCLFSIKREDFLGEAA
jgi:hypothetical protein